MLNVAIEKKRVAGKPAVQMAIHSTDPKERQEVLAFLKGQFRLTPSKKGPSIVEGVDSVVPVRRAIEERFSNVRFVSMVELEMLGTV